MEAIAYAQNNQSLETVLSRFYEYILNPAIVTLFAVALAIFFYGVIIYIKDANDKEARKKGKDHMFYGIIGFVIMIGVYGILNLLIRTFNITGVQISNEKIEVNHPNPPKINLPNFK